MARFNGKVILISGGARGQGAAEARLLVAEGASVVLGDVLEAEGEALARELGPAAQFLRLDVTEEADWMRAVAAAEARGPLTGLVNNAGIYVPKLMVPAMERAGGGSIVNISSTAGLRGSARAFAYGATKWALRGMTKSAAMELAPRGIRVNSVHPGPVATPMLDIRTPEENAARLKSVPMGRQGTAEEVARLVLFLLADDSSYMTGSEVAIDGGATL